MKAASFSRYFISLVAVALVALAGCIPPRFHRVQPGMSKDEVVHFVGQPRRRAYDDHFEKGSVETWFYDFTKPHTTQFDPYWIRFIDGRVSACEPDPARIDEKKKEEAAEKRRKFIAMIIPPDVGFRCNEGTDCQSGKCLDHKCAGPRDCTRAPGAECTSDTDCCSMKCNVGARVCL